MIAVAIVPKSFSENGVVAETSYQTSEIFLIFRSIEGLTSFNKDNRANLSGGKKKKKDNEAFRGVYFLRIREKS